MKNVARQKKVPVVDMTALTKEFVEDLGVDATIQQIYLPTLINTTNSLSN